MTTSGRSKKKRGAPWFILGLIVGALAMAVLLRSGVVEELWTAGERADADAEAEAAAAAAAAAAGSTAPAAVTAPVQPRPAAAPVESAPETPIDEEELEVDAAAVGMTSRSSDSQTGEP